MRTVIRIRFTGPSIPAVQERLRAADCGPDVATWEEVPVLEQVFAEVTLEQTDPRVSRLIAQLDPDGADWDKWHEDQFTEEEKESARLLLMEPNRGCEIDGGVRWGTTFDLGTGCPVCATGCRQTSALFVKGEDVPKLEGHRVAETYFWHILVDEGLAAALEDAAVTGLSFRSVYAVMPDNRQVKLRWRQLCAENVLPRMSPSTTGVERVAQSRKLRPCEVCGRNGHVLSREAPTRVVYRASDLRAALDVNWTWENYWSAHIDPDFRESILSRPWTVVTPNVYRLFREAGVTELHWHPVRVLEAG